MMGDALSDREQAYKPEQCNGLATHRSKQSRNVGFAYSCLSLSVRGESYKVMHTIQNSACLYY